MLSIHLHFIMGSPSDVDNIVHLTLLLSEKTECTLEC